MRTADFDYHLPENLIAQVPAPRRSDSRMMVLHRDSGQIEHRQITDLPAYAHRGDVMVFNDTRVIPARLFATWDDTGGRLELLLTGRVSGDTWEAMHQTRRKLLEGLLFTSCDGGIHGRVSGFSSEGRVFLKFREVDELDALLEREGVPPVPPYIRRDGTADERVVLDRERYQTVYAKVSGAVAAPTAGLHFTPELLAELSAGGVQQLFVTLHVGPGTFKPVSCDTPDEHPMHSEEYRISNETADRLVSGKQEGRRVIAVGTTCVRTLETAVRNAHGLCGGSGSSDLFIYPPFDFRVVDAMLTNFHLPRSTLLMLVAAFAGQGRHAGRDLVLSAYREAVSCGYRFYSYGDCMLIV